MGKCVPRARWRAPRGRVARLIHGLILVTILVERDGMCSESQNPLKLMNALRDPVEQFQGKTLPLGLKEI